MAKHRFTGALNAAAFPFLAALQSRTVVQPQLDNNIRTTQTFYGTEESANYGVPQLLFCENVLPIADGLQSVSYEEVIEAYGGSIFDQVITLRDSDENNFLFCPAGGANYIYRGNTGAWVSTNPISAAGKQVSRAYVNGRTFICYEGLGIYEYDTGTNTFNKLTLTGLADSDVSGIGSSSNYLIAFGGLTIYWSSLINPLDFTPSLLTGAGFAIPQDVKANITTVIGTAGGFIIYTAKNAVAAVYTNNIRAPFSFKEVNNAGGITSYEQVTSDQSAGPQFAWTTGGLQKITTQGSTSLSAEVNDFLAGGLYEYWDPVSKQIIPQRGGGTEFSVKVTYIGSRFLIISYSVDNSSTYQYALVFDVILERWGKLRFDHSDCFSYPYPNVFGDLTYGDLSGTTYEQLGDVTYEGLSEGLYSDPPSKKTVAFLRGDGSVHLLLMAFDKPEAQQGVAILGKFQLLRARMLTLQTLDIEGAHSNPDSIQPPLSAHLLTSIDGKNLSWVDPMVLLKSTPGLQRFARRRTGLNVSIALEGTFVLTTYMLEVTADGDR